MKTLEQLRDEGYQTAHAYMAHQVDGTIESHMQNERLLDEAVKAAIAFKNALKEASK